MIRSISIDGCIARNRDIDCVQATLGGKVLMAPPPNVVRESIDRLEDRIVETDYTTDVSLVTTEDVADAIGNTAIVECEPLFDRIDVYIAKDGVFIAGEEITASQITQIDEKPTIKWGLLTLFGNNNPVIKAVLL
jgi:hypothetical protein